MFVYNPNAGKGLIKLKLSDVLDIFVKSGYEITVYPTQCPQDGYNKILNMEDGYDLVVCSGGDGTLDEIVSGMVARQNQVPIGYIPAGTTNDFASSLDIPRDILEAAEVAVCGTPFSCDVGTLNDKVFVYVAAFGLFTDVSYQTNQNLKSILGHAAYVLEGAKRLTNIPAYSLKVTHDDETIEGEFMVGLITNSKSVAGVKGLTGKSVEFDDGEFEVTLVKKPRKPSELQDIITALLVENLNSEYMYTFKTSHIVVESEEEIPWTRDGEFGGDHARVEIFNKKQAVQIMVEKKKIDEVIAETE